MHVHMHMRTRTHACAHESAHRASSASRWAEASSSFERSTCVYASHAGMRCVRAHAQMCACVCMCACACIRALQCSHGASVRPRTVALRLSPRPTVRIDVHIDMCVDVSVGHICTHVYRHVCRHVHCVAAACCAVQLRIACVQVCACALVRYMCVYIGRGAFEYCGVRRRLRRQCLCRHARHAERIVQSATRIT